jgi:hypothetical protein
LFNTSRIPQVSPFKLPDSSGERIARLEPIFENPRSFYDRRFGSSSSDDFFQGWNSRESAMQVKKQILIG